jgi:hypothetical protein
MVMSNSGQVGMNSDHFQTHYKNGEFLSYRFS